HVEPPACKIRENSTYEHPGFSGGLPNHASFDQRNYGFKKLSDLFLAIDLFEMKKTDNSVLWVRDKKRATQLSKPK
ncbi:OST-HTH/LOTUS domain-containing protein, partial [Aeromonas rivipollensis]|uniref:OST-HTH/LOTUS domain-containing protein n=1 Tax=Aeromonas rivipollensis TaxID=948519 RepID=UPI003D08E0C5